MELGAQLLGVSLGTLERRVDARATMSYAAATADPNPFYLDDTREGGLLAPPMFAVAVTWPFFASLPERLGVASDVVARMVHATEHLAFHRLVRPGDRLELQGEVAAVLPTPAGTLLVARVVARDRTGAPVFEEHAGAMFRGVACADEGGSRGEVPVLADSSGAEAAWETTLDIPREAAHVYDACTDIEFPIHTSLAFARAVGLPDILLQGTALLAMAVRELVNREAGGDPQRVATLGCRFTGMVPPGASVAVRGFRPSAGELAVDVLDAADKPALRGSVSLRPA